VLIGEGEGAADRRLAVADHPAQPRERIARAPEIGAENERQCEQERYKDNRSAPHEPIIGRAIEAAPAAIDTGRSGGAKEVIRQLSETADKVRSFAVTPASAARGRVRLRTLSNLRWMAVAGQSAALFVVYFAFGYTLPLVQCPGAIASPIAKRQSISASTCCSLPPFSTSPVGSPTRSH